MFKSLRTAGARSKSEADVTAAIKYQWYKTDSFYFQCDHHQLVTEYQEPNLLKTE